ncbi:MAG: ATP-binding cassette subfamily B multidrug efflux pump, partial [Halopseudomonas sp.]
MFRWFEQRLNPFPSDEPQEPPRTLLAFCMYFTRGSWLYLSIAAVLMAGIAITEVWLFSFLGNIVDWLSVQNRETFIQNEGWKLVGMGLIVLLLLPLMILSNSLVSHQTLMGNYPMRIRWVVHRYLLKQSMAFYQDEFAGRIATKLMQTALAVRECVIKLIDVLNYVVVYFLGTLLVVGIADWRLTLPMIAWMLGYVLLMRVYIPKMGKVAERQADARSVMTGRIVDSYTNIQTVKLFSHSRRESTYAREGMDGFMVTVYRQMRLVTQVNFLLYMLNGLLLVSVTSLAIWLWLNEAATIGAVAVSTGLVLRLWGMSQWIMWELSALFENIGTVQDGINSIS